MRETDQWRESKSKKGKRKRVEWEEEEEEEEEASLVLHYFSPPPSLWYTWDWRESWKKKTEEEVNEENRDEIDRENEDERGKGSDELKRKEKQRKKERKNFPFMESLRSRRRHSYFLNRNLMGNWLQELPGSARDAYILYRIFSKIPIGRKSSSRLKEKVSQRSNVLDSLLENSAPCPIQWIITLGNIFCT